MNRAATEQAKSAVDAEVPPTQPHVADVLSIVTPGADAHHVTAMVANRAYGLDASRQQTTYDLPGTPENLGAGSVYKIFTSSAYLAQGGGIDNVIPVPAGGYASPLTPGFVVSNDGDFPPQMTLQDALAQSPNTAFVKLEETTGIAPVVDMAVRLGMRSLARIARARAAVDRRHGDGARTRRRSPSASRRPARSSSPTSARRSRATASGARPAPSRR